MSAGMVTLPRDSVFHQEVQRKKSAGGKRPVFFATAGERGVVRVRLHGTARIAAGIPALSGISKAHAPGQQQVDSSRHD